MPHYKRTFSQIALLAAVFAAISGSASAGTLSTDAWNSEVSGGYSTDLYADGENVVLSNPTATSLRVSSSALLAVRGSSFGCAVDSFSPTVIGCSSFPSGRVIRTEANSVNGGGLTTVRLVAEGVAVTGGSGNDSLTGRTLSGNGGDDTLYAYNNTADSLTCGPGNDKAYADFRDSVSSDCETIAIPEAEYVGPSDTPLQSPSSGWQPGSTVGCYESSGNFRGAELTYSRVWSRDGVAITGPSETGERYTIRRADVGHRISCRLTAQNRVSSASNTYTSEVIRLNGPTVRPQDFETEPAERIIFRVTPPSPSASDNNRSVYPGDTLTCDADNAIQAIDGEELTFSYEWSYINRRGESVTASAARSFTVDESLVGRSLRCSVTATNNGGSVVVGSSNPGTIAVSAGPRPTNTVSTAGNLRSSSSTPSSVSGSSSTGKTIVKRSPGIKFSSFTYKKRGRVKLFLKGSCASQAGEVLRLQATLKFPGNKKLLKKSFLCRKGKWSGTLSLAKKKLPKTVTVSYAGDAQLLKQEIIAPKLVKVKKR